VAYCFVPLCVVGSRLHLSCDRPVLCGIFKVNYKLFTQQRFDTVHSVFAGYIPRETGRRPILLTKRMQ